jgi:hypothetical protein
MKARKYLLVIIISMLYCLSFISLSYSAEQKQGPAIQQIQPSVSPSMVGPSNGACLVRDGVVQVPSQYDAPVSGTGYVMKKMGVIQKIDMLAQQCTNQIYEQLMNDYCKNNVGAGLWETVLYNNQGVQKGCPQGGCHYHDCSNFLGSCIVDLYYHPSTPNYYAPDVYKAYSNTLNWYVKKKMGVVFSEDEIKTKCTESIFQQIMSQFCSFFTADDVVSWRIILHKRDGNFAEGSAPLLLGLSSSKHCHVSLTYCLVRRTATPIPACNAPDSGDTYRKASITIEGETCDEKKFPKLMYESCAADANKQYEWDIIKCEPSTPNIVNSSQSWGTHSCPY